ncbi:MAG TPA: metallophosphoesterase family protein [Acidimicrobiales bacterium]|nr:metallophosphoesterase family protein [Acidimicrobiales bacterium]
MRIAVLGGAYSNPYALEAVLADARRRSCQRTFFLGDLGGFGAEPDALWPLLVGGGVECIAGNYDVAISQGGDDCGCGYRDPRDNEYAAIAFEYTRDHTSADFARWMGELPLEHREILDGVDVHMVHGSPLGVNDFFWESLPDHEVGARLDASGADLVLCTHSGLPWQKRLDDRLAVNVGVVGRPANDGRRDVWYAVVDLEGGRAEATLVPVAYDWRAQAASMRAAGLPEAFVDTIESGWWTSCLQVLPPLERSRGKYQLYRSEMAADQLHDGLGAASAAPDDALPVVALFGSALFPRRLWVSRAGDEGRRVELAAEAAESGFLEVCDADDTALVKRLAGPTDRPELTVTAEELRWHPAASDPGATVAAAGTPLAEARRRVTERVVAERQNDGRLPLAVGCAP